MNIYKKARINAAKRKDALSTIKGAAYELYISREKLAEIEQEDPQKKTRDPDVQDVINMVKLYDAPELYDHYCKHQCPICRGEKPLIQGELGEISASLMSAIHFLNNANDSIHKILADSKVNTNEYSEFKRIMSTLQDVVFSVQSLELWAKKNDIIE